MLYKFLHWSLDSKIPQQNNFESRDNHEIYINSSFTEIEKSIVNKNEHSLIPKLKQLKIKNSHLPLIEADELLEIANEKQTNISHRRVAYQLKIQEWKENRCLNQSASLLLISIRYLREKLRDR